jgi:hypothetical protein
VLLLLLLLLLALEQQSRSFMATERFSSPQRQSLVKKSVISLEVKSVGKHELGYRKTSSLTIPPSLSSSSSIPFTSSQDVDTKGC